MVEWNNKQSVDVSMFDEGHKQFIDIINKAAHLQKYENRGPGAISELLIEINAYARKHFRTEEANMLNCKYYDYKSHKDEHISFANRIPCYWQELADNNFKVVDTILEHLQWWLTSHIQGSDKKYVECFNENGLK